MPLSYLELLRNKLHSQFRKHEPSTVQMKLRDILQDRDFNIKLLSLTAPITLQSLMLALVAAGDALMLGAVSQDAMAAVSLATQIHFVQCMFLWSITAGISVLGAQYWGKNDKVVLGQIFGLSVRESTLLSIAFFAGCFFFPRELMLLFAKDEQLISLGAQYLKIASWSYLLAGISQCYLAIMRVSEHAARSAQISTMAVLLNIVLNAVFIFGLFGVPEMGVRGAAVATVIARIADLTWCIISTFEKTYIRLKIKDLFVFNWKLTGDFWRYTSPIFGAGMLWGIGFTAYTAIMGHMGTDAAAANAIAAVARDLMCCICNGLAGGAGILIGNELGAGNLIKGKEYGERTLILSILTGLLSMIVILAVIPLISCFMKLTPQAHTYMVGMFLILSVYMIGRCICTIVLGGIFASGGDTMFDFCTLIIFMWCFALPCAFIGAFVFHLPVLIVYACTCLDEVGKVPFVILHFRKYKWVKNITRNDLISNK